MEGKAGKLPPTGMDEESVSQSPGQEVGRPYERLRTLGLGRTQRLSAREFTTHTPQTVTHGTS
jgi:hypothetical protein